MSLWREPSGAGKPQVGKIASVTTWLQTESERNLMVHKAQGLPKPAVKAVKAVKPANSVANSGQLWQSAAPSPHDWRE